MANEKIGHFADNFGPGLRQRRKILGLTVSRLAELAGIHKSQLSRIERSLSNPSLRTFENLATVVGYSTADLLIARQQEDGRIGSMGELNLALGEFPHPLQESMLRVFWGITTLAKDMYQLGRLDSVESNLLEEG